MPRFVFLCLARVGLMSSADLMSISSALESIVVVAWSFRCSTVQVGEVISSWS